jgi:membrane protease YdiL (CAAX protease family)
MSYTYYFLAGVVAASLFIKSRDILLLLISTLVAFAFYSSVVSWIGALLIVTFAAITYYHYSYNDFRPLTWILMLGLAVALMLHKFPGFNNQLVLDRVQLSELSKPFPMYLNFDKCIAALLLFALSGLVKAEKLLNKSALIQTIKIWVCCVAVIIIPALLLGYVKLDFKLPPILMIWVINNLLFVCFAEEVLFRGIIQKRLHSDLKLSPYFAIAIASVLFGLAHFKGGIAYMLLAGICGLFYGYAYHKTNRVLCAMLVHFGLNLTHFIFFTYPFVR